jgi:MFS family permease
MTEDQPGSVPPAGAAAAGGTAGGAADDGRRRWLILAVIGIAQLMVVLDATIVNIALPSAQRALGFSVADRQWVVTAYALAFGGLLLIGGRLSDLLGRKRTFIAGLAGFAVASAAGGAAPGLAVLLAARAAQARSARCSPPRPWPCSARPSPTPASAAARSASSPPSPAAAVPSA